MSLLTPSDTLENAALKIAAGNPGAARVVADLIAQARAIDPLVEHPMELLVQLDRYRIVGGHLWLLFKEVCESDLVRLLAVLRFTHMGHVRPTDLRSAITLKAGGTPPPWLRPLDPVHVLSMVRAHYPTFGLENACPRS